MKSVMYHYVRNKSKLFPNYNILEKKNFVNQINTDNNKILTTYDAIQSVVVLFKVDMLQAFNINVDYQDADGD